MKKSLFTTLFLALSAVVFAQTTTTVNYWIIFKDKAHSPYSVSNPKAYLSERAIARRQRQHIEINMRDLPVNPAYVKGLTDLGAAVKNKSKWYNGVTITLSDASLLNKISALPYVQSVEKITISGTAHSADKFKLETASAPAIKTTEASTEKNITSTLNYGLAYNQAHMIGADCMHALGYMGQGMVIAQLDAGWLDANILPAFDSLRAHNQILGCRDFVTGDTMVYEDFPPGMNVLSCMGGNLPGQIIGTAPKASFWLLRTEDAATESIQEEINWMVGAEFADSVGADVINSSLGYSTFDDSSTNHTYADMNGNSTIITKAADWAESVGIFVTSSAGNAGGPPWFKITAPADGDSVLTVGAVDSLGVIANFSSRGPTYDGRIKPDVVAIGKGAVIAANGGGTTYSNGTSFSSPITAGAVACLWQANPTKTNIEILQAIKASCNHFNSPDTIRGYGIPDFCAANQILSGITEITQDEHFSVYPNPSKTYFVVDFYSNKKQTVTVELFDVSGRRISSENRVLDIYSENKFDIYGTENLARGIYILKLRTDDRVYSSKIIKE